jgi:hypothetical protein
LLYCFSAPPPPPKTSFLFALQLDNL